MRELSLSWVDGKTPTILFLGAHCDDIEIGCGGTILRLREERPDADLRWVVLSSSPERRKEAEASAARFLGARGASQLVVESFRDGFLPYIGAEVKDAFERLKGEIHPDLIFTHHREDLHQDHRMVNELTWNTWRDHVILEYEIPKYDGDLGRPNVFAPLRADQVEAKVKTVIDAYSSQTDKSWFDADTLRGLMRLRGVECNAPERFAEAFYARKLSISF